MGEQPTASMADPHGQPGILAHHFDTPEQQFAAGKLGLWLFLATEVLLFGGLFCAYAIYRANHPEIFLYAHKYLDTTLGGINTIVLICSSLTMAWAVRCAQCSQRRGLIALLVLTLLCAFGFLGIKYVEYKHKWHEGLLPGTHFDPQHAPGEHAEPSEAYQAGATHAGGEVTDGPASETVPSVQPPASAADTSGGETGQEAERSTIPEAATGPEGLAWFPWVNQREPHAEIKERPSNVHIFFGIYFTMTGLHGLHVIAGMVVIAWLLVRSIRGDFGAHYFTPVDFGGLYWHLVDLIWIFLFPLLYLIH